MKMLRAKRACRLREARLRERIWAENERTPKGNCSGCLNLTAGRGHSWLRLVDDMIVDERMAAFIDSLDRGNASFLDEIEKRALEEQIPIVRRSMQSLLKFLLAAWRPGRILEVGTAIGFSALLMSEYGPPGCHVTTIEKYEKRIPAALENFRRAGREDRITLLAGDAADILRELTGSYDMIFMDAAKGQYIHFLPEALRLLAPGGLLVSDNVLQDGDIIQSRFAVTRRNRTIHARMREYLYELKHNALLETVVLPVGDGAALSVKRRQDSDSLDGR